MRALAALVLAALAMILSPPAARAHEVRPALLQIVESGPGDYVVTFKRPVVGDMALRLAPHLSGGVLDKPPTREEVAPGFATRIWEVRNGPALDGQTVEIEGLSESVTDVLVRVSPAGGVPRDYVLKPSDPQLRLDLSPPRGVAIPGYLRLGVTHILTGFDHLLFVFGLMLLIGPNWRLLKAVTAFTVAHSLTLALAALGYIRFPSAAIEALVALSILFVASELAPGAHRPDTLARRSPWVIAFLFGLLHGMAFAGALAQVGLPKAAAPLALLLFNLGVELGQLMFIGSVLAAWAALKRVRMLASLGEAAWARAAPAYLIGGLSAYWLIERTLVAVTSQG